MTKQEIKQALTDGKQVCWANTGYLVSNHHNGLYITFTSNGYFSKLQDDELQKCFIAE